MPGAGCTREPCVQKRCTLRTQVPQVPPNTGIPCAMGYGLYVVSSVRRASGHRRLAFVTRGLIPASGNRDRTISPSTPARLVVARNRVHRIPRRVR